MADIVAALGVSRSSASIWVRDVPFTPRRGRRSARRREPNALQRAKAAEIERQREEGRRRIADLSEREFLVAGVALYAGEGAKRDGTVRFANTDPRMIAFSSAPGSVGSSTWTRHACESTSTSTRAWTWRRPNGSGPS